MPQSVTATQCSLPWIRVLSVGKVLVIKLLAWLVPLTVTEYDEPPDTGKHMDVERRTEKRRKYDENYITLGFTCISTGSSIQPQCVVCAKVLSHNSMKPSLLHRHLETNHPHLKNKPREFFERELRGLSTSKQSIKNPDAVNKKGLEASYMVSYRVAQTGKPHTIVEDFFLPAAADAVGVMLGEKAKNVIQSMPSSNNTVSRRISAMAGDVFKQLLHRIRASEFYSLQLDESTDVAGLAQLLVYVRYIYDGSVKEDMLFCKPLETRTTGEDIFRMLDTFVALNGLLWTKCVGICTDGARAMTGRHSGVVTRVQAVAPDATWVHCGIHREALAAKGMPGSLKSALDKTVKIVNFVKSRPLNSRIFTALCNEMGSDHTTLLLHTEVRWLLRGKVLTRVFELRDELKMFFVDHTFHLSDNLHDPEFLSRLAYLSDIFSKLNELNLGLQRLSATIFNVRDKIETMIQKLKLWIDCVGKNKPEAFPLLHDFLCENHIILTDGIKHDITTHLCELAAELRRYFPDSDESDSWIRHPFSTVPAALPVSEQENLIDIASTGSMKIDFHHKPLPDFWIGLCTEYPQLATRAVKKLMPFATTYLCERGFSALTSLKTKYWHRLYVEDDLRLKLSLIRPDIKGLCASSRAHPSH
ncbi:zinc finger BED domain-containing protein 5-like [Neoarius graeffei]|uniref:zinc finger BED domain-containing protein 5-like n=1 Tax=Neoarius graeffei TaxID=443677 RepID=UPI00298CFBAB|nr:zinc finger BED domain-containing protein 5-like [Neoarius graeffei]